jgi:hypothetical protein
VDIRDITHRFAFHPATTAEKRDEHTSIRVQCAHLAHNLNEQLPDGREKSTAIERLEEVMFWGNAAIARANPDRPSAGDPAARLADTDRLFLNAVQVSNPALDAHLADLRAADLPPSSFVAEAMRDLPGVSIYNPFAIADELDDDEDDPAE